MEFSGTEKSRTKEMWNQSGAVVREHRTKADERKVPKEYHGYENGKMKKTVPLELRRLEHAYGSVSIGVNQKDNMVVLMNRKTGFQEEGLTQAQKGIRMERAHQESEGAGSCYMDSFCGKEGAFAWEESIKDSPEKIWKQLQTVPEREGLEVAAGWLGNEVHHIPEEKREELFRKIRRNIKEAVQEARQQTEETKEDILTVQFCQTPVISEHEDGLEEQEDGDHGETGNLNI